MGEGGALLSAEQWEDASQAYQQAAVLAEDPEDLATMLDGYRMASYCQERGKKWQLAWDYGLSALEVGEKIEEKDRPNTTLAYVGQGLLRIAKRRPFKKQKKEIMQKMDELLGKDWEESIDNA